MISDELKHRILKVKLLIVDNDGVLTDGRVALGDYGDELKFFDAQDGFGVVLLKRAGVPTVMVTGKKSKINPRRAKEIRIVKVYQDAFDKLSVFQKVLKKFKVSADEVCCIADDLVDIPILKRAGFAVAVSNAVPEVKGISHYVTDRAGGRGAVREVADLLLKTQGKWGLVTDHYYR